MPRSFTSTHQRSTRSAPYVPRRLARASYPTTAIQTTPTTTVSGRTPPAFLPSSPLSPQCLAHLYYFGIRGPRRWGPKVDLPDVQGCLQSALGARARSSSHAASASQTKAFNEFLDHIGTLNTPVGLLEKRIATLMARSEGGAPNAERAARELVKTQGELRDT